MMTNAHDIPPAPPKKTKEAMCLLVSDSFAHHAHVYRSNFILKRTVQIAFIGMGAPVALKFYVVARDTMALSKCSASSLKGVSRVFSAINTALDK